LTGQVVATAALPDGSLLELQVRPTPGENAVVASPSGTLRLHDLTLEIA
jgi:hypothetical protein